MQEHIGGGPDSRRAVGRGRLVVAVLAATVVACDGSITGAHGVGPSGAGPGGSQNGGTTGSGADAGTPPGGGVVLSSELPCTAYGVLSAYCWSCHGTTPAGGAPQSLATLAALDAPAPGNPTVTNGARAVVRIQSTTSPMPPTPNAAVPPPEASAFAAWVNAGMPAGSCVTDGGTPPPVDAGPPPPPDPLGAAPTCTSQSTWTGGTRGSTNMEPGHACITCHVQQGGPTFNVGGTVYPTGHEPDDCNGSGASGAVITVTDATGASASFVASSVSGNFHGTAQLTFPITARVTFNGKTRAMTTAVATGDCNSCHTQNGANAAPGRITLPP